MKRIVIIFLILSLFLTSFQLSYGGSLPDIPGLPQGQYSPGPGTEPFDPKNPQPPQPIKQKQPEFDFKSLGRLVPMVLKGKMKIGDLIKTAVLNYLGQLLQQALSDIQKVPTNDTNAQEQIKDTTEEFKKSSADQFRFQLEQILKDALDYMSMRLANVVGNDLIRKTNDFLIRDRKAYKDVMTSLGFAQGVSSFVANTRDCLPPVVISMIENQLRDAKLEFNQGLQKAVRGFKFLPIRDLGRLIDPLLRSLRAKQCDEQQLAPRTTPPFIGSAPSRQSRRLSFNQIFDRFKPFASARKSLLAQAGQATTPESLQELQQTIEQIASEDMIRKFIYMVEYTPMMAANIAGSEKIAKEVEAKEQQAESDANTGYASQQGSGADVIDYTDHPFAAAMEAFDQCVKDFEAANKDDPQQLAQASKICEEIHLSITTPAPIIQEIAKTGIKAETEAAQKTEGENVLTSLLANYLRMTIFQIIDKSLAGITSSLSGITGQASRDVAQKYTSANIDKACEGMASLGDEQLAIDSCKNALENQQAKMAALTQTETEVIINQITALFSQLTTTLSGLDQAADRLNNQIVPTIETNLSQQLDAKEAAGFEVTELRNQLQELIIEQLEPAKAKLGELSTRAETTMDDLGELAPSHELRTIIEQLEALNNSQLAQEIAAKTAELAALTSGATGQSHPFANAMSTISNILANTRLQFLFISGTSCDNCTIDDLTTKTGEAINFPGTEMSLNTGAVDFLDGLKDRKFNNRYEPTGVFGPNRGFDIFSGDIFFLASQIFGTNKIKLNQNNIVTAILNNLNKAVSGEVTSAWITPTKNYFEKATRVYKKLQQFGANKGWLGQTIEFNLSGQTDEVEISSFLNHLSQLTEAMAKLLEMAEALKSGGAGVVASPRVAELQAHLTQLNQEYDKQKNGLLDKLAEALKNIDLDNLRDILYRLEKETEVLELEISNFKATLDELERKATELEQTINALAVTPPKRQLAATQPRESLIHRLTQAVALPLKALGALTANVLRLLNPLHYLK